MGFGFAITGSKKTDKEEMIDSRCIVKFRPGDDWNGQYGFDWFREGDYGELMKGTTPKGSTVNAYNNNWEAITIKSKSDYKADNIVGKYGDVEVFTFNDNDGVINKKTEFRLKTGVHNILNHSEIDAHNNRVYYFFDKRSGSEDEYDAYGENNRYLYYNNQRKTEKY